MPLPRTQNRLRPGTKCTVAGWGLIGLNTRTDTLQCVQLRVQRDRVCRRRFMFYNGRTQICVGDPRQRKSAFLVRPRHLLTLTGDPGQTGQWDGPHSHGCSLGPRSEGCGGAFPHASGVWGNRRSTRHEGCSRAVFSWGRGGNVTWIGLEKQPQSGLKLSDGKIQKLFFCTPPPSHLTHSQHWKELPSTPVFSEGWERATGVGGPGKLSALSLLCL